MISKYSTILLLFIIVFSNFTFGQKTQQITTNELREVIELSLNLPELQQYFHIEELPERLPIKINEFGEINAENLNGIEIFGTEILVLSDEKIKQEDILDFLHFSDWILIDNQLQFTLGYPIEGIIVNFIFEKIDLKWRITSAELSEL